MKSLIFKKHSKNRSIFKLVAFLITLGCLTMAKAQNIPLTGKALFENKCAKCHGTDGAKGRWGAKNLQISQLNNDELFKTISTGRGIMPNWGKKLSALQIRSVIEYIKTLRKY